MQLQVKMPEKSRNNLFRSKQTTNKGPSKILRGFKVGGKVRMMLSTIKQHNKLLWNIFTL